jgi:hypothetical protein
MNKTNKTKNKSVKTTTASVKSTKGRRSMKGKWGKVGAPPKSTFFPRGTFTMESLFNQNKNQCELSLRTKVDDKIADGSLIALKPKKQAGGKVGRPKSVFVLKENFDSTKHEVAPPKAARKVKSVVVETPAVVIEVLETIFPVVPPVTNVVAPTVETVVETVPASPVVETVVVAEVSAPADHEMVTGGVDTHTNYVIHSPVMSESDNESAPAAPVASPVSPIFG